MKTEGRNLKISNKKLEEDFLNILDQTETDKQNPKKYLVYFVF
jgi:hypothetical protein